MRTTAHGPRRLAVIAVLAVAMAACGGTETAETESTAGAQDVVDVGAVDDEPSADAEEDTSATALDEVAQDAGPTDVEEDAPEPGADGSEAPSPVGDPAPRTPLATVAGSEPFVELEVLDLRRDGDAVTLEFSVLVGEEEGFVSAMWVFAAGPDQFRPATDEGEAGANDPRGKSMSGVTLVDRSNANRHLVLRDSQGYCLCTRFMEAKPGQRYIHSAQFPAPPADVDSMTVEVPLFPSIDNVPIREVS